MSVAGGGIGLIAGGLLTTYASWRWVMFVNVPIGLVVAGLAARVLPESDRRTGRFDIPGALTGTLGVASMVYGLSSAATSPDGVSHWTDTKVVASLTAALALLAAFGVIEARSNHALLPMRLLGNRNRSGAYLISLCVGTAMFGMFFFLTIFMQTVWGYSALKTGIAYLPMIGIVLVTSAAASQLISRTSALPMLAAGGVIATGGMFWLSRVSEHSTYAGGILGPMIVTAFGLGFVFVPMNLTALVKVDEHIAGVASSLLNTGQQVGGSIGLAVLGTVAWSTFASSLRSQHIAAGRSGQHLSLPAMTDHALAVGFSRGLLVAAGIMLLTLIITMATIRVRRTDLAGINPMAAPA
jgi:predicted MFS family arabinose efflux permease